MLFSILKFVRNHHGISLMDVLVSMGMFGIVMLLFQSIILTGGSFTKKATSRVQFHQVTANLKAHVCTNSDSFKMIGLNAHKTFKFVPCTPTPCSNDEYQSLGSSDDRVSDPILTVSLSGLGAESSLSTTQDTAVQSTLSNYSGTPDQYTGFSGTLSNETGVMVHQDSHTFTKFDVTANNVTNNLLAAGDITGKIFISRCIPRIASSVYRKTGYFTTIDMDSPNSTLIYLLNIPQRPFYFPNAAIDKRVKCCDTTTSPIEEGGTACPDNNINDYNPIMYIVHFENTTTISGTPTGNIFDAKMTDIQEYPALSEINTIYGAGFVFTLDEEQKEPQKFFLDMMVLKNKCNTNFAQSNICENISLYPAITDQQFSDMIVPTVNSCTGIVSTMDSSIIQL